MPLPVPLTQVGAALSALCYRDAADNRGSKQNASASGFGMGATPSPLYLLAAKSIVGHVSLRARHETLLQGRV